MDYKLYITKDPKIMLGKPIIKGTRITVELIIRKLGGGYSIEELLEEYPHLNREQILAALQYAAALVENSITLDNAA